MKIKPSCLIAALLLVMVLPLTVCAEPVYETVPIPQNKLLATNKLLDELASGIDVEYHIYNGLTPEIVLYGEPENIALAKQMLSVYEAPTVFNDLVKIDCSLETVSEGDLKSVGILPTSGIQGYGDLSWSSGSPKMSWPFGFATLDNLATAKLQQALSKGTILINSSLTTPNGIGSTLDVVESIPLASGSGSTASITYKDIPINVRVTPTVISYDKEHPERSLVRLAIRMQVSYINNASTASDYSNTYPYIGARETESIRIARADGNPFVAAAFARDQIVHASIGIPLLKDIPVLGYLFGEQYNRFETEFCVLRVNLNFVPQNKIQDANNSKAKPVTENPRVKDFVDRVMGETTATGTVQPVISVSP